MQTGIITLAALSGLCFGQGDGADVIENVIEHYKAIDGARVTLAMEFDAGDSPMAAMFENMNTATHGYAVRPNLFAFWPAEGSTGMMGMPMPVIYCDGVRMISAVPDQGVYSDEDAPADLGELKPDMDGGMMPSSPLQLIAGADLFLQLLAADPGQTLGEMLEGAEYLGKQESDEGSYYAFKASPDAPMAEGVEMEVRFAGEGEPWLIALKPDLGDQAAMMGDISMLMTFSDWSAIGGAPEEGRIEIDAEWEKTDNLVQTVLGDMMGGMGGGEDFESFDEPEAPGTGEAAADFSLEVLGGGHFQLGDQRGKVVVLDFWATWCGPCVRGLPTVTSVTADYADKGVVFAAVNLEEDAERVTEFMKTKGWDFTVLMDHDGAVSRDYGVTGIPHSVIIDKQGVVRHVEVGFAGPERAEKMLREHLDKLTGE